MKILIVRKYSFTSKRKTEIETALEFLHKYTPLKWSIEYREDRDLEDNLKLEGSDKDNLDEHAIKAYINAPEYDFIHLDLTDSTWQKLELRKTLYGQSEYIGGQGITYGRWTESNTSTVKRMPQHLQFLSEVGLGIIHEIGHCLTYKFNVNYTAHYHFYGYKSKVTKAQEKANKPRRYVRTPDPDVYYQNLAWKDEKPPEMTGKLAFKGNPAISTIVLHHTAVSRASQPLQGDSVDSYHKSQCNMVSELGFYTGYNFFAEPTGKRTQTRKIGEETIAQVGNNCDVASRCGMISYCMAGDFRKEKPTQFQVDDFVKFVNEVRAIYPNAIIKQHKDVQPSRTCAELPASEIESWFTPVPDKETKDQAIARLTESNEKLTKMNVQLIAMVTTLIKLVTK